MWPTLVFVSFAVLFGVLAFVCNLIVGIEEEKRRGRRAKPADTAPHPSHSDFARLGVVQIP